MVAADDTFRMAAFWRAEDGLLREGVEYWVTVGGEEPPPGRADELRRRARVAAQPEAPPPAREGEEGGGEDDRERDGRPIEP